MYLVLYPLCDNGQPIGPQITENWREEAGGWTQIGVGSGYECASSLHESKNSGSCLLRWAPQTRLSQSRLDCAVYSAHQHLPRTQQIFTVSPEEAHNVSCCIWQSNFKSKELMRRCSHKYMGREFLAGVFCFSCVCVWNVWLISPVKLPLFDTILSTWSRVG